MAENYRDYLLRYAEAHSFLDENLAIGAYIGKLVLGPIGTGSRSESLFSKDKVLVFTQNQLPYLAKALKIAKWCYEEEDGQPFVMDIKEPTKREGLRKITASFGSIDDTTDPRLNIRRRWNWASDKDYHARVLEGTAPEYTQTEPWLWTKRGSVISEEALEELLDQLETIMTATYIEPDQGMGNKLSGFIDYAFTNFGAEIDRKLENYQELKKNVRSQFIGNMFDAWIKLEKNPDEQFNLEKIKTVVLKRVPLIWALLFLRSEKPQIWGPTLASN